jgi:hypothetical protein
MILIQVVPHGKKDAYKLLREKVSREASTFSWEDKPKTKLAHKNAKGYIEIDSADGVIVARVFPKDPRSEEVLLEKFVGRLTAWFRDELAAINVQFVADPPGRKTVKRVTNK